jgi:hypothetical protein
MTYQLTGYEELQVNPTNPATGSISPYFITVTTGQIAGLNDTPSSFAAQAALFPTEDPHNAGYPWIDGSFVRISQG